MAKTKALEGTVIQPRLLNNAQRKALAAIIEKRLETKLQLAREQEKELEQQIVWKLAKRFKADAIQSQITKLEDDISNLKKMRDELGFELEYGGDFKITGGEAQKLLEAEIKEHSVSIRAIENRRDILTQGVWLAETVEEARNAIQEIEQL